MALLDRIANYFKEWDGIDETAPKMELNIHELRYIADMNIERCRLIRQLNEVNLKTEEIHDKAISEFAERLKNSQNAHIWCCRDTMMEMCSGDDCESCMNQFKEQIDEIAEEMRGAE